ncbi:MAG: exopolyphosphatase / guanosine-5-triphosphate,3-diphosphate pyrophosphatase [Hyphomicrobiales bacterium]|nr:exopolyphosphatase / guanosine-5-triphosphate,3-diphosphate pyrophosphatase [Hyphomicrobiales bacterium]
MDDEARTRSGLDSRREPRGRAPWNRRWPPRHARHDGAPQGHARTAYAALDLGTNNCRLLVARPNREGFRVIDAFSRIIRLGEGMAASGRLGDAAISRAIEALGVCRDKMHNRGVTRARLIATEACRSAANGIEFRDRVKDEVGLELEIVDRETEAGLAAIGCTPLMDPQCDGVILFDIGGGSSEIVRLGRNRPATGGPPEPCIRGWASLPIGVVSLAERYGGVKVDRVVFDAMTAEVRAYVERFAAEYGDGLALDAIHLLGTSGTVTTIAGVHLRLKRYDRRQVDGCWMTDQEVSVVLEELLAMDYDGRVASPCIGGERADLVMAGCAILEAIRQVFPCTRLRVADRGLREGMLVELMRADGVWNGAQANAP